MTETGYVELHACSAFSFLEGASQPEDLVKAAFEHGMPAMALLDRNGLYGSARVFIPPQNKTACARTLAQRLLCLTSACA